MLRSKTHWDCCLPFAARLSEVMLGWLILSRQDGLGTVCCRVSWSLDCSQMQWRYVELGSANLQAAPVASQQNYSVDVAIASGEWDVLSHLFLSAGCDITFAPLKTEFRDLSMNQSSKMPDATKQARRNTLTKSRNISDHCIFVRNNSTQWTGRQQGDSSAVWLIKSMLLFHSENTEVVQDTSHEGKPFLCKEGKER